MPKRVLTILTKIDLGFVHLPGGQTFQKNFSLKIIELFVIAALVLSDIRSINTRYTYFLHAFFLYKEALNISISIRFSTLNYNCKLQVLRESEGKLTSASRNLGVERTTS